MKRLLFITGKPGIGKTTVLLNAVNELKNKGYKTGGMLSREIRQDGRRIGFEIIDLATGQKGWLAHVNQPSGPQVSRYRVNLHDLDQIGVNAIQTSLREAEVTAIDEIGPMELFSKAFQQVIEDALEGQKLIVGVIHQRARDPIIGSVRKRSDAEIFDTTIENRQWLHNILIERAVQFLEEKPA